MVAMTVLFPQKFKISEMQLKLQLKLQLKQEIEVPDIYFEEDYNNVLYSSLMGMPPKALSQLNKHIIGHLGKTQPLRILSLGCGDGSLDIHLLSKKDFYLGVDNSDMMLNALKNNALNLNKEISIEKSDIFHFLKEYNEKSFNICLCFGILPFYNNNTINKIIKSIHKILVPGGLLIFYIEKKAFRWFEYRPLKDEYYANNIIKRFFLTLNEIRDKHSLKPQYAFYSDSYWKRKISFLSKSNLFNIADEFEIEWHNRKLSYRNLLDIFTGKEKVLQLTFFISEEERALVYKKYCKLLANKLDCKTSIDFARKFIVLEKT